MNTKASMIKIDFLTDDVQKIALAMKYWTYEKGAFVFDLDELLTLHHNKSKRELAHTIALHATAWLVGRTCSKCKGRLTVDSRTDAISKLRDPERNECIQCALSAIEDEKKRVLEQKEAEVARLAALEATKRSLYKSQFNDLCSKRVDLDEADDFVALCIGLLEHSLKDTWRDQRLNSSDVYRIFGWPLSDLLKDLLSRGVLRQDPYKMDYEQLKLSKCGKFLEAIDLGSIKFQLPFKSQGGTVQKFFEEQVKNREFGLNASASRFLSHVLSAECIVYLLHLLKDHAINPKGAITDPDSKLSSLLKTIETSYFDAFPRLTLAECWKRTWVAYKRTTKAPWAGHSLDNFSKALIGNIHQELQKPNLALHESAAWMRSCPPTPLFEYSAQKLGYSESFSGAA